MSKMFWTLSGGNRKMTVCCRGERINLQMGGEEMIFTQEEWDNFVAKMDRLFGMGKVGAQ